MCILARKYDLQPLFTACSGSTVGRYEYEEKINHVSGE